MSSYYTAKSADEILEEMLDNIPDDYIKSVGTFTHDLTKTYALEGAQLEKNISDIWDFFDIHRLTGEELDKRVFQLQGLSRKPATYSIGELTVNGTGTITIGDIFETINGVQFKSLESKSIVNTGIIKIQAVIPGDISNVGAKTITQMPVTIQGIKSCNNEKATYDGFNAETDESLLSRYDIKVQMPATSGNVYHYMQWAREVAGVGDSKVFPLWNGKNTVKVLLINDLKQIASSELVKKVQDYIDPKGIDNSSWGCGYGEAPIGAYCTIESAKAKNININITLTKEDGVDIVTLKERIKKNLTSFLQSIAFKKNYVSYSLLSNSILETPGVLEWSSLTINDGTSNIQINDEEVAILGEVTIHEN
ncbi:baseplate J/gp47 family protein [Fusobacterium sp.]|uniref:baseplate J/gp47 family protein n=1 Tax=Fusobacterium sp. TaxID=68766 RepID=UPI00261F5661|nr:baseplate J/gp47 family protein [Fusobacterium sp.]